MVLVPGYVPPNRVAVLPMHNQSNDLRGPEIVRREFFEHLKMRGYDVLPMERTDAILRDKLGIDDGGQLGVSTPQKIGRLLDVDAVIYCDLIDFKHINVGFYQDRMVEAAFKMVDTRTGEVLWEDQRKASKKEVQTTVKGATDALAKGLAERAARNVLNVPLQEQARLCVRMALSTLPAGNGGSTLDFYLRPTNREAR